MKIPRNAVVSRDLGGGAKGFKSEPVEGLLRLGVFGPGSSGPGSSGLEVGSGPSGPGSSGSGSSGSGSGVGYGRAAVRLS